MFKAVARAVAEILIVLGSTACILVWLEIKPRNLAVMTLPHVLWLILGVILFCVSSGSSLRALYLSTIALRRMQEEHEHELEQKRLSMFEEIQAKYQPKAEFERQLSAQKQISDENFKKYAEESRAHGETKLALATITTYRDQAVKERNDIVNRSTATLVSICVISLSIEPSTIRRGRTVKIRYLVESSRDVIESLWLGAAFQDKNKQWIFNRAQDKPIRILKGSHEYDRDLTIPANIDPGNYTLQASVWRGDLSDSKEDNRVARGKGVPIVIEA
jgi:hypothetical protein